MAVKQSSDERSPIIAFTSSTDRPAIGPRVVDCNNASTALPVVGLGLINSFNVARLDRELEIKAEEAMVETN
jgi:hypothetical protein